MRKHDHLVEPLFGALRHHAEDQGAEARPDVRLARGRVLAGLLVGVAALIAALTLLS